MADQPQRLNHLMARIREGDQEAVRELLDEYGAFLLHVIRRRLAARLRTQFDSADVAQSVWASFFAGPLKERHFDSPRDLLAYLVSIAQNKMCDVKRKRLQTQKRSLTRVRSLEGSAARQAYTTPAAQPSPSQLVLAEDQWERLLDGQPDHYRRILLLLRQGHTHGEVARELRLNERTIRRVVALAALKLRTGGGP